MIIYFIRHKGEVICETSLPRAIDKARELAIEEQGYVTISYIPRYSDDRENAECIIKAFDGRYM